MRAIKISFVFCVLFFSIKGHALIIDYSVEGIVSNLGGSANIIGLSKGDKVYASWTINTELVTDQKIISTAPSTESGMPTVASLNVEGGISDFSLNTAKSSIISNSSSTHNSIYIGENGAPPTDTQSIHDSGIHIDGLSNGGEFSLIDLAGTCCGKSILVKDFDAQLEPAAYMLSDFHFGYGFFMYEDISMSWAAEYIHSSISASIRTSTVPLPSPLPIMSLGLIFVYTRRLNSCLV